jgi:cytochrome c peroxidase
MNIRPLAATLTTLAALTARTALPVAAQPIPPEAATRPARLLAEYTQLAGAEPSAERGQKFFDTNFGKQMGWSCSTCHTRNPLRAGKNDATEKPIKPLAPAAEPTRFTDRRKVDFFFKINCNDVVGRECTAAEKADVLAWLTSLKP